MVARSDSSRIGRPRQPAVAAIGALAAALIAGASVGVLETGEGTNSIRLSSLDPPLVVFGPSDFSLIGWVRRTSWEDGQRYAVLDGGGVIRVEIDDANDGIVFTLDGSPSPIRAVAPLRDATADAKVPVNEWILFAGSWDAAAGTLTAWARSESVDLVSASATDRAWSGAVAWPFRLGASDTAPAFTGQLGLVVLRDHQVTAFDVDAIWNDGAPHYFAPALLEAGNMTGFEGIEWMVGHGILSTPGLAANPAAEGAELGDAVNTNNLLVYLEAGPGGFHDAGRVQSVAGTWTMHSPHTPGAPHAGFFVRELPDLSLGEPPWAARASPLAHRLAVDEPDGLIRVIVSANSRGVRLTHSYGSPENWALGGIFAARRSSMAGMMVPATGNFFAPWPAFNARLVGTVHDTIATPLASVAFGNYGSHGASNPYFPGFALAGRGVVIEDGGAYVPKARPESGTLFDDRTEPLTVRAMVLRFPGSGDVVVQGEKAITQLAENVTTEGSPATVSLDTTVVERAMSPADAFDAAATTLTLDGAVAGIEVGYACFIAAGGGAGGISMVSAVDTSSGATVLTLERWFPVDPDPATSLLRFGPVDVTWVAHAWDGLAADDPEEYRGIRLTASGGIVVVLYQECFNPEANGFIVGPAGRSGAGYGIQLRDLFDDHGVMYMKGLEADVWLQFFAHQISSPTSMGDYTDAIRAVSPGTEVWWCGDPDLDTGIDDVEGTDAWQQWILDNAEAYGVGAVVAHGHPSIGTGAERAADGQSANRSHLSGRGCALYVEAVLDLMGSAARVAPSCPADLDGDGMVGFSDLTKILAVWGPCDGCLEDLDADGQVGFSDLTQILAAWGPCGVPN